MTFLFLITAIAGDPDLALLLSNSTKGMTGDEPYIVTSVRIEDRAAGETLVITESYVRPGEGRPHMTENRIVPIAGITKIVLFRDEAATNRRNSYLIITYRAGDNEIYSFEADQRTQPVTAFRLGRYTEQQAERAIARLEEKRRR